MTKSIPIFFILCIFVIIIINIKGNNKKKNDTNPSLICIEDAKYINSVVLSQDKQPLPNIKVYEEAISEKELAVTNSKGELKFTTSVCSKVTLIFIT
ncbi:hypothetical protein [Bacillus sp. 166amftsu]|uniref:hypothetical protein n=1 Tax=Bacillus sp. 166amftsu TaxID=1761753 RepID=UPI0008986EB7|nr:hypothetical protein [Bacillus sp. 166amftsu]SDY83681.1 hypothetical protein SAMN04488156_102647 [Bacillus sp. 166amftsu]